MTRPETTAPMDDVIANLVLLLDLLDPDPQSAGRELLAVADLEQAARRIEHWHLAA